MKDQITLNECSMNVTGAKVLRMFPVRWDGGSIMIGIGFILHTPA